MLYLSVSAVRDYMSCPKRYWWRVIERHPPVVNEYVKRGQVIHNAIEKCNNIEDAIAFVKDAYEFDFIPTDISDDTLKMISNYYNIIEPQLGNKDKYLVEKSFKVRWDDTAYIVGKIDRITEDKTKLYDWKTSYKQPKLSTLQDPQFYVYHWAMKKMYNKEPEVYYGHLLSGKLFKVDIQEKMWYNVKYLIEKILNELEGRTYFPRVAGYQCASCFFNDVCWKEFNNELDNRRVY